MNRLEKRRAAHGKKPGGHKGFSVSGLGLFLFHIICYNSFNGVNGSRASDARENIETC